MKIILINPPRWNELLGKNPSIIEKHRGFNLPLGLLYLASVVEKNTDYQIEVFDAQPKKYTYLKLEDYFRDKSYDIVGIPAMTYTLVDVVKTLKLMKKIMPNASIVLGGPLVHLFPYESVQLENVDFAFIGEADLSFLEFLKNFNNYDSYQKIPGLVYKDKKGNIIKNNPIAIENLDQIPFPDRGLINIKHYNSLLSQKDISTTMISSRGCPFKCAFCEIPFFPAASHFRARSAKNLADEICECLELGINEFLFYDETFTINKKRVLEICEEIMQRKLKIRWNIRTRVDVIDEEMLSALKKSGCVAIHYGVEAGNDRMLKIIKKGFTITKTKEIFALTKRIGIETLGYFIIGLPTEKLEDIQDTFSLSKELKCDYAHFTIFSPSPGTDFYYSGIEKGIIKKDVWKEFVQNPTQDFKIPLWEENFTREQLYEIIGKIYKGFYLRPTYMLSRIKNIKSREDFIKKTKAGLSVFFMQKETVDKLI